MALIMERATQSKFDSRFPTSLVPRLARSKAWCHHWELPEQKHACTLLENCLCSKLLGSGRSRKADSLTRKVRVGRVPYANMSQLHICHLAGHGLSSARWNDASLEEFNASLRILRKTTMLGHTHTLSLPRHTRL